MCSDHWADVSAGLTRDKRSSQCHFIDAHETKDDSIDNVPLSTDYKPYLARPQRNCALISNAFT